MYSAPIILCLAAPVDTVIDGSRRSDDAPEWSEFLESITLELVRRGHGH